ncbi:hypothetical protein D3C78_819920 [compost metagenome]
MLKLATEHHRNEFGPRQAADVSGADEAAIAQHSHPVGNIIDLIEEVGDDDDADAAGAQVFQHPEQHLDLMGVKAGCRFVQHQHLAGKIDGAGNGDDLADSDGIAGKQGVDVDGKPVLGEQRLRILLHRAAVDQPEAAWLAAEKQVFGDREIFEKVHFLIDRADAKRLRLAHIGGRDFAALQKDRTAVAVINASQDFDERRFARAVFAKQGMDFTVPERKIDAIERRDPQKGFADGACFQKWCRFGH